MLIDQRLSELKCACPVFSRIFGHQVEAAAAKPTYALKLAVVELRKEEPRDPFWRPNFGSLWLSEFKLSFSLSLFLVT